MAPLPLGQKAHSGESVGLGVERKTTKYIYFQNEGQKRAVWEKNMRAIELHNRQRSPGRPGFRMQMNAFGDMVSATRTA